MTTPLPRSEFAVTQHYVYLNHAAAGVLPRSSRATIESFLKSHGEAGVLGTFPYDQKMPEYREKIGAFIGASGSEIATIPNTSWGANTVALGVDWKAGDEVLLCDNEFPSNAVPWLQLKDRGVVARQLRTDLARLTPDLLRREISKRTRIVAVSWVSYADGYRHDLGALADVAHAAGALLCVDAMQGLGAFPLDVRAAGIDALYAGGGKWLLGLHGIGILYLSQSCGGRLRLAMPGWRSVADMWDFHNYEQPMSGEAMRFESGTPNLVGTLSLVCAIDLFARSGPGRIAEHVLGLTDRLCSGLESLGAELLSLRGVDTSSGIVTFRFPGRDSVAVGRALQEEGIVTTYRSTGIRISPHGYNTLDEIDLALGALQRQTRQAEKV